MEKRRTFSKELLGSYAFMSLAFEAQALYLHMCMAADDDGFVLAPKRVQRGIGASAVALDELKEAGYIIFDDGGGCMIAHWGQGDVGDEKAELIKKQTRERVRRYRERKKQLEEENHD